MALGPRKNGNNCSMSVCVHFDTILFKKYNMDTVYFAIEKKGTFDSLGMRVVARLALDVVVN